MDYALDYDNKVLNGDHVAGFPIRRACYIDKTNRKRSKRNDYPYYYDPKIANRYVKLTKLISPRPPVDFQLWFISIINGWRLKSDPKIRRYNNSIFSTARKNAKSTLAAVILVSELLKNELAGKLNKEYYVIASKLSQALLTLRQCKTMINRLKDISNLANDFKITRNRIYSTKTGSLIQALPSRSDNLDGLNADIAIVDEEHSLKSSKLIDVLNSSMAQNPNALLMSTTTAGFNYQGPLKKDWDVAIDALKNKDLNSRSFNALFTQDNKREISDPATWIKSNPLLAVSKVSKVMKPFLKQQLNNALVKGRDNSVLTKSFNMWGSENSNAFIDLDKWKENTVKPVDLSRRSASIGVDLSKVRDLTAVSIVVPLKNGKYFTDVHAFVADRGGIDNKSKADKINYNALAKAGLVTIEKDNYGLINYHDVSDYILNIIDNYHLKTPVPICYDPWGASSGLIQDLGNNDKVNLIKVRQSVANLTNTIHWLYALIVSHCLLHKKNILYNYAFNNVCTSYDRGGRIYLNKSRAVNKIDPVFALIDALYMQQKLKDRDNSPTLSDQIKNNDIIF